MIKLNLQLFGGRGSSGGGGGSVGGASTQAREQAMNGENAEERAYGLKDALGGSGWYAKNGTVTKAEDLGGEYMTEVNISTSRKGYFKATFTYSDGESFKETYDSVSAVARAANSFFNRGRTT